MKLSELIINDIKPLHINHKISDLNLLFNRLTFSHMPIKDDANRYVGSFSATDAHCFESTKELEQYHYAIEKFFVRDSALLLDVLEAFATNATNIMPVLSQQNVYLGYYELNDVINILGDTPFFNESGTVLVVEKGINDYNFSELSQIIESNNGKLLGAFVSNTTNDMAQITLKITNTGLNEIIQTFRRYNYTIASGHHHDSYVENLKERSAYLNKYLNI